MNPLLLLPFFVSILTVLFVMPLWIKKAKQIGLIWEDMHKPGFPKNVAGSGGLVVILGFVLGILMYVFIQTFYLKSFSQQIETFALITSVLIVGFIGLTDDLFGWKKGGLSMQARLVLILLAAIPLVVINAGESVMMGIQLGALYPIFFIPLGIVGATATFNFLAGYNGLETSQGIIILSALAIATYITGNAWLSIIAICMVVSLLGFYLFNKYPAHIFPGDTLTYSVGVLIAGIAIMGNIEKVAVIFFIPYIIETILKVRGKLKKYSFAKLNNDGSLEEPYDKIYGLEHLSIRILKKIKKKVYEKDVVLLINAFQILIILLGFLVVFII